MAYQFCTEADTRVTAQRLLRSVRHLASLVGRYRLPVCHLRAACPGKFPEVFPSSWDEQNMRWEVQPRIVESGRQRFSRLNYVPTRWRTNHALAATICGVCRRKR
jgi:hypothetical protein